jgi:type II secretory pathway component PulC
VKHPLWIANSTLLVLVILSLVFVYWSRIRVSSRNSIQPFKYTKPSQEPAAHLNIKMIYEDDLFDTYHQEPSPVDVQEEATIVFPEPPTPIVSVMPPQPEPSFLEPLNITLTGILIIGSDNARSTALVKNNATKHEAVLHIGDMFEDATLVRVLSNKVLFLRSNGQQEVLYLRPEDAKEDAIFINKDEWSQVVKQEGTNIFIINAKTFAAQVKSLAQFIDMLHLTTVYDKGKSVGCRIGTLDEKSLGIEMGLQSGDVITHILSIATGPVENRMKIYHSIIDMPYGNAFDVILRRNGVKQILQFIIQSSEEFSNSKQLETAEATLQKQKNDETINILKEKYKVAPTLQDIRRREQQHIQEQGSIPAKPNVTP